MGSNPPVVTTGDLASYQDGDAQFLIDQATAAVRGACGWHVTPSLTETVTLSGDGATYLALPSLHVTDVASVSVDGTLLDVADYSWTAAGIVKRANPWWCRFDGQVTVTFTHGYDVAEDLAAVILSRAGRMQSNPKGAVRQQAGPFAEQYESGGGFTADEMATIRRYAIPAGT